MNFNHKEQLKWALRTCTKGNVAHSVRLIASLCRRAAPASCSLWFNNHPLSTLGIAYFDKNS